MMQFYYYSLTKAHKATGTIVVVDVLRAFTTAAYAFNLGAERIFPVGSIQEAYEIKESLPGSLIMGEVGGYKPEGFDYSNSPFELINKGLACKYLIQRTSAGTQGIVRTKSCESVLAASFVVAEATANYLKSQNPPVVSFIITGNSKGRDGDEDQACAEYIQALINDQQPVSETFTSRVLTSSVGKSFLAGESNFISQEDIELSIKADIFNFAIVLSDDEDHLFMVPKPILSI